MRSTLVKVVCASAAALVLLAGPAAGPASAASPSGTIYEPSADQEIVSVDGISVAGKFSSPSSTGEITAVNLSLRSVRGDHLQTKSYDAAGAAEFPYEWSTFEPGMFDYNGEYRFRAEAGYRDPLDPNASPTVVTRTFFLAVAPIAPRNVEASFDSSARTVAVSWTGSPEPDLLGYLVERAEDGGAYAHVAEVEAGTTTYTDDVEDLGGDYSYRVVALREGAQDLNANPSEAYEALNSDPSTPARVSVAAPPTTTSEQSSTTQGGQTSQTSEPATTSTSEQRTFDQEGRVDLSGFAALLDQARRPQPRPTTTDPGFTDELPYGTRPPTTAAPTTAGRPEVEIALADDGDSELGEGERLRSMAFLAGGLFAFVLLMHLVWIRSEVKHAPLEVTDPSDTTDPPDPPDAPGTANEDGPDGPGDGAGAGTLRTRPRKSPRTTPRKRSPRARGAAHRVPSRSGRDRREGRPAVRAGR